MAGKGKTINMTSRFALCALAAATALTAFAAPAAAQQVDRIVTFGDSYADTGIARTVILADAAANPVFKGQVAALYPTGRFSGGTNYIDTLSTILGAPVENFAVGGALTRSIGGGFNTNCVPSPATCPLGFTYEVDQFLNVGAQSPLFPTTGPLFDANDLLTISIGGNDARHYQVTGGTLVGATAAADLSVTAATADLNRLVAAGAPTISFLAGNTALLPEIAGDPTAQGIRDLYSTRFNTGIQSTLAGYADAGVMVHYLDLTTVLESVAANPAAYGIANLGPCTPLASCVGDSNLQNQFLFYVDALHLSSRGFAIVAQYVAVQLTAPLTLQAPSDLALDISHQWGRTLTSRMDLGAPRDGDMPEGMHAYIVGDSVSRRVDATDRNDEFKNDGFGGTLGVEYGFGSGVVGIAGNVSKGHSDFGNDAAEDNFRSIQLGAYAGIGIAGGFVQGYLGHGWDRHKLERAGVVEAMDARVDGDHTVAGLKAGYLMPFGAVRIGPIVGLDYATASVDGYAEDGDAALALNVDSVDYKSLRGSIGAEVRGDFGDDGVQFRPFAALTAEKDLTGDSRTLTFSQQTSPGIVNRWDAEDGSSKIYGRLAGGMSAAIFTGVNLDAALSTTISKDQGDETSAHLGLRVGF